MGAIENDHINLEQLEELLDAQLTGRETDSRRHLVECSECRASLCRLALDRGELKSLLEGPVVGRNASCPKEEVWFSVAAGLAPSDEALRHALECPGCGELLRMAVEDLSDDLTPEQETLLSAISFSGHRGRADFIRKLAASSGSGRSRKPGWGRFVWSLIAAAVAVFLAVLLYPLWQTYRADRFIAVSLQAGRPFEFRLDAVPYGPLSIQRSVAFSEITPEYVRNSRRGWRADLLDGQPSAAIDRLEKLRRNDASPSSQVLSDLAAAYAIRGDQSRNRSDYETALSIIDALLQREPTHTVALFNRALLFERLARQEELKDAVDSLLRVERDPDWRREAESLLQ